MINIQLAISKAPPPSHLPSPSARPNPSPCSRATCHICHAIPRFPLAAWAVAEKGRGKPGSAGGVGADTTRVFHQSRRGVPQGSALAPCLFRFDLISRSSGSAPAVRLVFSPLIYELVA